MNKITFDINNQGIMILSQNKPDKEIILTTNDSNGYNVNWTISAGDMVMLMNYYRYQKDNNKPIF